MAKKEKLLERAQKYIQKGYFEKAIGEYKNLTAMDPLDISVRLRLGDLYVKTGKKEDAIKEYMEVAKVNTKKGFYLKAIAVYKQILKLDDAIMDIHYRLADLYTKQRLLADAISEYSFIANNFEKKGKTTDALELLKKMAEIDPENVGVKLKLADLHQKLGFDKDALEEYSWVFDRLLSQGKFDKAEKIYSDVYKNHPEDPKILEGLSEVYRKKGDSEKFADYSGKLLVLYKDSGEAEKARALCEAILEVKPDSENARSLLSELKGEVPEEVPPQPVTVQEAETREKVEEAEASEEEPLISWDEASEEVTEEAEAKEVTGEALPTEAEPVVESPEEAVTEVTEEGLEEEEFVEVEIPVEEEKEPEEVQKLEAVESVEEVEKVEEAAEEDSVEEVLEEIPAEEVVEEAPTKEAPAEEALEEVPAEEVVEEAPVEEVLEEVPAEEVVEEAPAEEVLEEVPAEEVVEEAPAEEAFEEVPAEEVVEEAPVEEALEEVPAEEVVEEAPAEEAFEEVPAEEVVEEAPSMEHFDKIEEINPEDLSEEFHEGEKTIGDHVEKEEAHEEDYVDLSRELGLEEALDSVIHPWEQGEQGDRGEAVSEFKDSLGKQLSKEDTETHHNLGIAYMEMELYDDSTREFKIALKDPAFEFDSYMRLGLCAMMTKNTDEAIEYYLKALKVKGTNDEERKGIMYELGLAYEAAGKTLEAGEMFRSVYHLDPRFREVFDRVKDYEELRPSIPIDDSMIEVEILL
jgi:tetratricopeptide (TPR) repeat protein